MTPAPLPEWPKKPTAQDVTATGLMFNIQLVEMKRAYERALSANQRKETP